MQRPALLICKRRRRIQPLAVVPDVRPSAAATILAEVAQSCHAMIHLHLVRLAALVRPCSWLPSAAYIGLSVLPS